MRHTLLVLLATLLACEQAPAQRPDSVEEAMWLGGNDTDYEVDGVEESYENGPADIGAGEYDDDDELNCEHICPRYYRPLCVERAGQLITYATPCEFENELRCARVALQQRNVPMATYRLRHQGACEPPL